MSLTVVVTGAHGFIGRHVARCAAVRGDVVCGVGHGLWSADEQRAWGLQHWHDGDVTTDALRSLRVMPDVIVHCAGSGSVGASAGDPKAAYQRSIGSLGAVLGFVKQDAPKCRVVFPSSAGVYGQTRVVPIPEDATVQPISVYGEQKTVAETMLREAAARDGVAAAVVRLFSVYGAGLRKQLLWDACGKLAAGDAKFMGTGAEVRDWVHVEDAAMLLLAAADNASTTCPVVNGGSGVGVSVREVVERLRETVAPARAVTFSGAQRAGDPDRFIADTRRALAWGWTPQRAWHDGMAEYAAWWMGSQR